MKDFPESWEWLARLWQRRASTPLPDELTNEQAKALLREQFLVRQAARDVSRRVYDLEKAWRRVTRHSRRVNTRRVAIAACTTAVALLSYLLLSPPVAELPGTPSVVITPGTVRAELQLASGEIIPLETHGIDARWREQGIVLENDTASGRLRYEVMAASDEETRFHALHVPRGGEYQLELPDGTRAWINSRSTVRFPTRFGITSRDVYLQGEALFQVARDERLPFRVHAGEQVITVTGTRFNVSAYDDDEVWRATLVEGSVRVEENGQSRVLQPSEQYVLDHSRETRSVVTVDDVLYTSWVEGRFYFKAFMFEELVRKLERWYDFRMIYADESIKYKRFTGHVDKHEPIERALALLEMTTNIQFKVVDRTITARLAK